VSERALASAGLRVKTEMAIRKEYGDEATGAEKAPSQVGRFVLYILIGLVLALGIVLLYLHYHSLGLR
jgi:hypothetical protein